MTDGDLRRQIATYYSRLGLPPEAWHIGPEHPALETLGIGIAERLVRILELGVQSGGFAIPVVMAVHTRDGFSYTGVDNLAYDNAVRLRLIEAFLREAGVTEPLRFIESDSTAVLRATRAGSVDLILMDHYKPKYPIDLYLICSRDLLSVPGAIILHDVLAHAAPEWEVCKRICDAFGYVWTLHPDVPMGAAVVRRGRQPRTDPTLALTVYLRWYRHALLLTARRAAGSLMRTLRLRR